MKSLITAIVFLTSLNTMAAASVLLKTRTIVGFAPVEYRGVFTTSILSNGVVEHVDNKGKATQVLKLSKAAAKNLAAQVNALQVEGLQGEDGPLCMDAPSTEHYAVKAGQEIMIKSVYGCREKVMYSAYNLNLVIQAADTLTDFLK